MIRISVHIGSEEHEVGTVYGTAFGVADDDSASDYRQMIAAMVRDWAESYEEEDDAD